MEEYDGLSKEEAQNKAIRKRLADKFSEVQKETNLSVNGLFHMLEKESDTNNGIFNVSYNTISNVLSSSLTTTPNFYAVLSLCRLWNLDTAYVFSPPSSNTADMPSTENILDDGKYVLVDNPQYMGNFYGYLNVPNAESIDYAQFDLFIGNINGRKRAKFTYKGNPLDENGNQIDYTKVYYGAPILQVKKNNIFILFTNDTGGMFFMYFSYKEYNAQNNYFRKGIIVTSETAADNPVVESFVIFRNPICHEKREKYLKGFFPLTENVFYIGKSEVQKLATQDPDVQNFWETYRYMFEHEKTELYPISIAEIMAKIKCSDKETQYSMIKALLVLKQNSIAPARLVYEHNVKVAHFTRDYLQRGFQNKKLDSHNA